MRGKNYFACSRAKLLASEGSTLSSSDPMVVVQAQQRLLACTELLGEREETILELSADIEDMKQLYREQIDFVLGSGKGQTLREVVESE